MVLVSAMVRKPASWIWRYWVAHNVTVSSVDPMKMIMGRAKMMPMTERMTVVTKVKSRP